MLLYKEMDTLTSPYPCGTVVKDVEGIRWIMLASKKGRRWEKIIDTFPYCGIPNCEVATNNYQVYQTHDNGARPFDVIVTVDKIFVLLNQENREPEHLMTITNYKTIFIGADSGMPGTEGNSVLLQTKEGDYIFIGISICRFQTESPIIEYYSPIGPNDVIYPYAVTKDRVYLLLDNVSIERKSLTMYTTYENCHTTPGEPYFEYYGYGGRKINGRPFKAVELYDSRGGRQRIRE